MSIYIEEWIKKYLKQFNMQAPNVHCNRTVTNTSINFSFLIEFINLVWKLYKVSIYTRSELYDKQLLNVKNLLGQYQCATTVNLTKRWQRPIGARRPKLIDWLIDDVKVVVNAELGRHNLPITHKTPEPVPQVSSVIERLYFIIRTGARGHSQS
jgi:hypothetical protein